MANPSKDLQRGCRGACAEARYPSRTSLEVALIMRQLSGEKSSQELHPSGQSPDGRRLKIA